MTNTQIWPPIVARTQVAGLLDAAQTDSRHVSAMASLMDSNGNNVTDQLGGSLQVSGYLISDREVNGGGGGSRRSRQSLYFVFPDLWVAWKGTYTIYISVFLFSNPGGMTCYAEAQTRYFDAYDEEIAFERPSEFSLAT